MDPLTDTLINLGGTGLLAAALFVLHRKALRTFREELRLERETCERRHAEVITAIKELKSCD